MEAKIRKLEADLRRLKSTLETISSLAIAPGEVCATKLALIAITAEKALNELKERVREG